MKLSALYLLRYQSNREFRRRVDSLVEDFVDRMLADEQDKIVEDKLNRLDMVEYARIACGVRL